MRKFLPVIHSLILFALIGCGGGGGGDFVLPPQTRDLSGLEGNWRVVLHLTGSFTTPEGTFNPSGTEYETWTITTNTIRSGVNFGWGYDGSTLYVQWKETDPYNIQGCGNGTMSWDRVLKIAIKPGATYAVITGTQKYSYKTDFCGKGGGTIDITGSMSVI